MEEQCNFPFIYKGVEVNTCNLPGFPGKGRFGVDGFYGYCSTTPNMDRDRRFRPCTYFGELSVGFVCWKLFEHFRCGSNI